MHTHTDMQLSLAFVFALASLSPSLSLCLDIVTITVQFFQVEVRFAVTGSSSMIFACLLCLASLYLLSLPHPTFRALVMKFNDNT